MDNPETLCRKLILGRYFPETSVWRKKTNWSLVKAELTGRLEAITHRAKIGLPNFFDAVLTQEISSAIRYADSMLTITPDYSTGRESLPKGDR